MSKKGLVIGLVVVAAVVGGGFTVKSLEKVDTGKVGVVYSMKGGVKDETLGQGGSFY